MAWMNEKWLEEVLEDIRNMTLEEATATAIRAGIIDEDGNLTERYRPPEGWKPAEHPDLGVADKLRQMPRTQVIATLREAGILDPAGRLEERFRPVPESVAEKSSG
jgi:hypothetical protein